MPIILKYKHQQKTAVLLRKRLKDHNRVAYVYPTGGGKTFPALEYVEECENLSNGEKYALIIVPSLIIKSQYRKYIEKYMTEWSDLLKTKKIRLATYQALSKINEMKDFKADIVICDEAHRMGAATWEPELDIFMKNHPNAKYIGITATPKRTDGRNMLYEKFADSVIYEMSMTEALDGSKEGEVVLQGARYERMLSALKSELKRYRIEIDKIENLARKEKTIEIYRKLESLVSNEPDMPDIMAQAMRNKNGKYIVFCANRYDMQEKMKRAKEIFGKVNENISMYYVLSRDGKNDIFGKTPFSNRETLEKFEDAKEDGTLQLMFCVDMLDEGKHIAGLDGIVMFKPTESWIVYSQEVGRIMSIDAKEDRIIIDAVNNWIRQIDTFMEIEHAMGKGKDKTDNSYYKFFKLQPEELELLDLLREIDEQLKTRTIHDTFSEYIEFYEKNKRKPRGHFSKDGKRLKADELTDEEKDEMHLYQRWRISEERKMLKKCKGKEIEEVPKEYRYKIKKLRELGLEEKTTYEEVVEYLEENGREPKQNFSGKGKTILMKDLSEEEQYEKRLAKRWAYSTEKKILDEYAERDIQEVPEQYREQVATLRSFGLGLKKKIKHDTYEEFVEFLEENGRTPIGNFGKDSRRLLMDELTPEQKAEVNLYGRWKNSKEKEKLDKYTGVELDDIPVEDRVKIAKLRSFGLGIEQKTTYEEYIEFIEEHGKAPSPGFKKPGAGRNLKVNELTPEQLEEVHLSARWRNAPERKVLDDFAGRDIAEVPEEYRQRIQKLRDLGIKGKAKGKKIQDRMRKAVIDNIEDLEEARKELKPQKIKVKEDIT